jgi:predicted ABC-class ATPase
MIVSQCPPEVIERTALRINPSTGDITVLMGIGFPAQGRTIQSRLLEQILFHELPECVKRSLLYASLDAQSLISVANRADDWTFIREQLRPLGLVAFIANGSILPRESGISTLPLMNAVPFISPPTLEVTLNLPHRGPTAGMGVRAGVTLIIGGGYHGKSTLLHALEVSVYPHVAGDGREYCVSDPTAFTLRSEAGRSVKRTDISLFVSNLPGDRDTRSFSTKDASGSTSQAANAIDAMESGVSLLLLDEDTSATNFMVRDELMQRVVHRDKEPITPFIDRVRDLYEQMGISSVIVAGSSGAFFHVADWIIQMDTYRPCDVTEIAKEEAQAFPFAREKIEFVRPVFARYPTADRGDRDRRQLRGGKSYGTNEILVNDEHIEVRYLAQLVDREQAVTLSHLLVYAENRLFNGRLTMTEIVDRLYAEMVERGLWAIVEMRYIPPDLALPRKQEILSCFSRYRKLPIPQE